jgi:hypothetical protein
MKGDPDGWEGAAIVVGRRVRDVLCVVAQHAPLRFPSWRCGRWVDRGLWIVMGLWWGLLVGCWADRGGSSRDRRAARKQMVRVWARGGVLTLPSGCRPWEMRCVDRGVSGWRRTREPMRGVTMGGARTVSLCTGRIVERCCSKSDFDAKSLTATKDDR